MLRRFDFYKTTGDGIILTDYGHSPESINHLLEELKTIFPGKKVHLIFQPHLYSRTHNFFDSFVEALSKSHRISLIDIYPARERQEDWQNLVSSKMLYDKLATIHPDVYYAGESKHIASKMQNKIDEQEITCFIGAGDMDFYYPGLFEKLGAKSLF